MKKYVFVDFIRFWGMFAIVYVHAIATCGEAFNVNSDSVQHAYLFEFLQVPLKYGTVCFFMISGFLLGDKLLTSSPGSYLKKRLDNTLKPYFVAFVLFVLFNSVLDIFGAKAGEVGVDKYFGVLVTQFKATLFYTAYWFIWNFFIGLTVILLLRKYIFTVALPLILLLVTLVYSANIYQLWFSPLHTKAAFGFVFYLWAGVFIHKNQQTVNSFIQRTPLLMFVLVAVVFLGLDFYETSLLSARHSADPHNTLKVSTQLFSVAMFFLLMKISDIGVPRFFNPRKETFGIYLYHLFFVVLFVRLIPFTLLNKFSDTLGAAGPILAFFCYFLITYFGVTFFVKAVNKTRFSWLVGNKDLHKPEKLAREFRPSAVAE